MSSRRVSQNSIQALPPRRWAGLILLYLMIPLVLLVCGGDLGWWQAWLYALLIFAAGIGGRIWAERRHPGLMADRQGRENIQGAAWALAENRFFYSVVCIRLDRGHAVCDSGPYRIVRHPGYAGNIPPLLGIALALGSVWTLIPAAVALVITVTRTALEDQVLYEELPGYLDYAQRVRYRLIPGVY